MKYTLKLYFFLVLVCFLMTACSRSGISYISGRYVLADSGRSYLIFEGDDKTHFVKMDVQKDADVTFDTFQTGDLVKVTLAVIREDDTLEDGILEYMPIRAIEKRQVGTQGDISAEHLEEIDRVDLLWDSLEDAIEEMKKGE